MAGPNYDPDAILDWLWKRVPGWASRLPGWLVTVLGVVGFFLALVGWLLAFYLVLRITLDLLSAACASTACLALGWHLIEGERRRRVYDEFAHLYTARANGWMTEAEFKVAKDRINARRALGGWGRRRALGLIRTLDLLTGAVFLLLVLNTLRQWIEGLLR